jgi:uncharacterized protein (TIGR02996 family)
MTPHPDRLALLRAIGADPEDDTPRLVYADWLDEHGPTDADRARAEFLRVACKLKPKVRITKDEQAWLAANWRRLVPTLAARLTALGWEPDGPRDGLQWSGRHLKLWILHRNRREPGMLLDVDLEFWRGLARRVVYVHGFDAVAAATAADEPLARHELMHELLTYPRPLAGGRFRVAVGAADCFGRAVWDRVAGYTAVAAVPRGEVKQFDRTGGGPLARVDLHRAALDAIAAAMTAEARHRAGWPEDLPTLGG